MKESRESTESAVIEAILDGEIELFSSIVKSYQEQLFRVALGYLASPVDAEEVVQEVFIKAYNSLGSFKRESKLSTWLYRICVNSSLNELARRKRRRAFTGFEEVGEWELVRTAQSSPEREYIEQEQDREVRRAIDSLPKNQRTAFILQRYQELSQREIAQIMNRSEGSVEQLLQRGKRNLRRALSNLK